MGVSLKMKDLKIFATKMTSNTIFFAPRTPQQNGVVVRKNRSLE